MKQEIFDKAVDYIVENQNKFYRLAYSYVQNKEDALDVVQNAIFKALENCSSLRNEDAIRTWFYRIVVNESLLFLKKKKKEQLLGEDETIEIPYYEQAYEAGEEELYVQISRLEADVQSIIKLRFFEEMSLQEIADVMEMNLNTVKAKLYRGLKLLKQNMQEVGV